MPRLATLEGGGNYLLNAKWERLGDDTVITLGSEGRFVILQGISQEFAHTLLIKQGVELIQVTASFNPVPKDGSVLSLPYPSKGDNIVD